jgi:hypothetical protein
MTYFDERVNFLRLSSENGKKPLPRVTLGAVNRDGIEGHPTRFPYSNVLFANTNQSGSLALR